MTRIETNRYRSFQRSRLSEIRVNSGADVIYEGSNNWEDLAEFLSQQAKRPLKTDFIVGLETHFAEDILTEMKDALDELGNRLLIGVDEQVIIIKPIK